MRGGAASSTRSAATALSPELHRESNSNSNININSNM